MEKNSYTDFKNMVNGPGYFTLGDIVLRVRTGKCDFWDESIDTLVALDLSEHEYLNDVYSFSMLDMKKRRVYTVGWISFDELIDKAKPILEDDTIYLTLAIKELHPMETLININKTQRGCNKNHENKIKK